MNVSYRLLLENFREYLAAQNFSHRTVKEYPSGVKKFLSYLESEEDSPEIKQVTSKHLRSYHLSLMKEEFKGSALSSVTIRVRLGMIKSFFKFLHNVGGSYHDPTANYPLPKRNKTLPKNILEVYEVINILEKPNSLDPLGARDKAMLELLYSTGIRNEEIRNLELKNLELREGTLRLVGKGNVEGVIPFGDYAKRALTNYLLFSRPLFQGRSQMGRGAIPKKEFLFLTKNGKQVDAKSLLNRIKKYVEMAGIEKQVGAHSFRHSCATHLLKNGADIRQIQRLLRHKNLDTTQLYTRVDVTDLKETQQKFHPREQ